MLRAIYFTDPWDRGMGWTVRYSCVSERDRWTPRGMSHDSMGPWDGMDSRTHASVEGQVDIPWKVPLGCGMGWTIYGISELRNAVNCSSHPTVPWDHGITWDCPSHPTASWDFPWDVHLSLYRCMCPTVHPIPRCHGSMWFWGGP